MQWLARLLYTQKVGGSNPPSSTERFCFACETKTDERVHDAAADDRPASSRSMCSARHRQPLQHLCRFENVYCQGAGMPSRALRRYGRQDGSDAGKHDGTSKMHEGRSGDLSPLETNPTTDCVSRFSPTRPPLQSSRPPAERGQCQVRPNGVTSIGMARSRHSANAIVNPGVMMATRTVRTGGTAVPICAHPGERTGSFITRHLGSATTFPSISGCLRGRMASSSHQWSAPIGFELSPFRRPLCQRRDRRGR